MGASGGASRVVLSSIGSFSFLNAAKAMYRAVLSSNATLLRDIYHGYLNCLPLHIRIQKVILPIYQCQELDRGKGGI